MHGCHVPRCTCAGGAPMHAALMRGVPWWVRKSTNRLKRLSEEIRRSTRVVRLFPNAESCPPWERGLPGRTEKSRQGWRRSRQRRADTDASAGRGAGAPKEVASAMTTFLHKLVDIIALGATGGPRPYPHFGRQRAHAPHRSGHRIGWHDSTPIVSPPASATSRVGPPLATAPHCQGGRHPLEVPTSGHRPLRLPPAVKRALREPDDGPIVPSPTPWPFATGRALHSRFPTGG